MKLIHIASTLIGFMVCVLAVLAGLQTVFLLMPIGIFGMLVGRTVLMILLGAPQHVEDRIQRLNHLPKNDAKDIHYCARLNIGLAISVGVLLVQYLAVPFTIAYIMAVVLYIQSSNYIFRQYMPA